jgi:UDP-N-acetylglucosamine 2-epimerase (non-hydrolysing)
MTDQREKILIVFGTRPEAIKMFPVIFALKEADRFDVRVCVTGQHRGMLDQVLSIAGVEPDFDLAVMQPNQSLDRLTATLLTSLGELIDREAPARVMVQGDTATAMCAALAAYYRKVPVDHVEAGLRSGNIYHPWPEEINRKIIGSIADLHFAPTATSATALERETVDPSRVFTTGNTVIDAVQWINSRSAVEPELFATVATLEQRFASKRIIGVTTHRRENFGEGLDNIAGAIARIAAREDVAIIFPVHLNPAVQAVMHRALGHLSNVALVEPLDYPNFARLLRVADMMLTDSGGVQEEAPAFGTPVLVMRETTERPEGIEAGTAKLVGTDPVRIVDEVFRLLDDRAVYEAMARAHNPFGDGHAAQRIAGILADQA